jgi:hypothetical protein
MGSDQIVFAAGKFREKSAVGYFDGNWRGGRPCEPNQQVDSGSRGRSPHQVDTITNCQPVLNRPATHLKSAQQNFCGGV